MKTAQNEHATSCGALGSCVLCTDNGTNVEVRAGWHLHMTGGLAAVLPCPNRLACARRPHTRL